MGFLNNIYNTLTDAESRKISKKLSYLLEEEFVYTYPDFTLEFLEKEIGADKQLINRVLLKKYQQSFYELKRRLRVSFLGEMVKRSQDDTSLHDYSVLCGYSDHEAMLRDVKTETGLDFEEFCRYIKHVKERSN